MPEECAYCGAPHGSKSDLVDHVRRAHGGGSFLERAATDPESGVPGLRCALCGRRFPDKESLARHSVTPHYRSNRPLPPGVSWA
jgi:uncharacterized C2H2 Zn-finger protein